LLKTRRNPLSWGEGTVGLYSKTGREGACAPCKKEEWWGPFQSWISGPKKEKQESGQVNHIVRKKKMISGGRAAPEKMNAHPKEVPFSNQGGGGHLLKGNWNPEGVLG